MFIYGMINVALLYDLFTILVHEQTYALLSLWNESYGFAGTVPSL